MNQPAGRLARCATGTRLPDCGTQEHTRVGSELADAKLVAGAAWRRREPRLGAWPRPMEPARPKPGPPPVWTRARVAILAQAAERLPPVLAQKFAGNRAAPFGLECARTSRVQRNSRPRGRRVHVRGLVVPICAARCALLTILSSRIVSSREEPTGRGSVPPDDRLR